MSDFGLFRYVDENVYDYWLDMPNIKAHGQTHIDASQGIINLASLGVESKHWKERFGSIALQTLCAGILQVEPTATTLLAELETQFYFDIVKGAFKIDEIQILRSPDARHFKYIDYVLASSLEIIRNGSDLTRDFMPVSFLSDDVFGNGDTFAVVDLIVVDKSGWEVPVLITE